MDDLLITGLSESLLKEFKAKLMNEFDMSDLGEMSYFLGLQFIQTSDFIYIQQSKYAKELLKKFQMEECKDVDTPLASN